MTPELPRAPRSRAEALVEAAWPMEREGFFLASAAAVPMVRDILVPVSPSGTGNTLSSLMLCFWALMAAEAWTIMRWNNAPSIQSIIAR